MGLWRRKGWIGVHFGARTLRLAQVERTNDGLRIAASVVMPRTAAGPTDRDPAGEGIEWSGREILAGLSLNPGFCGRRAACVLPMRLADLRTLEIPPGNEHEQRAMVAHQLSSAFDGERQPREFAFWEIGPAAPAKPLAKQGVTSISVPGRVVSRMIRRLSEARLRCEVMDGLPLTLARAVRLAYVDNGDTPIGAVDWGFTSGTFCAVVDGHPQFTRHLRSCGLGAMVASVGRALGLSEDAAMQLLAKHGLPEPKCPAGDGREIQEVIAEVASGQLSEIADELGKTIAYLHKQHAGVLPRRLCLFGEGATIRNVPAFLSAKVGLPVERWRLRPAENGDGADSANRSELLGTAVALSALAWES